MKAISLLQPWASLVVIGAKKIETRSWNTTYRGELLIHASKKFSDDLKEIASNTPFKEVLTEAGLLKIRRGFYFTECEFNLPTGAIIGQVNLNLTTRFDGEEVWLTDREKAFGDVSPGRYGWLLTDPKKFTVPIPAKGSLGLWEYSFVSSL
jgi:hypothetical protein